MVFLILSEAAKYLNVSSSSSKSAEALKLELTSRLTMTKVASSLAQKWRRYHPRPPSSPHLYGVFYWLSHVYQIWLAMSLKVQEMVRRGIL